MQLLQHAVLLALQQDLDRPRLADARDERPGEVRERVPRARAVGCDGGEERCEQGGERREEVERGERVRRGDEEGRFEEDSEQRPVRVVGLVVVEVEVVSL